MPSVRLTLSDSSRSAWFWARDVRLEGRDVVLKRTDIVTVSTLAEFNQLTPHISRNSLRFFIEDGKWYVQRLGKNSIGLKKGRNAILRMRKRRKYVIDKGWCIIFPGKVPHSAELSFHVPHRAKYTIACSFPVDEAGWMSCR